MIVSVIGYRNHAARVILQLSKSFLVKEIFVFHPNKKFEVRSKNLEKKKISYTNNFSDLEKSKCNFICSPTNTHIHYIRKIIELNRYSYIYCEKPPANNLKELEWLKENKKNLQDRLFFGFNLRFSQLFRFLDQANVKKIYGEPIACNLQLSYGLAFKESYRENWRFNDSSIFSKVTGNIGIHFVDMFQILFGDIESMKVIEKNISGNKQVDTTSILLKHTNNYVSSIFLSYATVFTFEAKFFYSDGLLEFKDNKLALFAPRDTFNRRNEFCRPNPKILFEEKNEDDGLSACLEKFLSFVKESQRIPIFYYEASIKANYLFLTLD